MAKLMVLPLFVILAIHYGQAIDMGRCAQLVIAKGAPELGIPSHDPLIVKKNISFHLDNLVGSPFTFTLSEFTWTNLPWWKSLRNTVTKNTTEYFDVEGEFWWDNFTISFNYDYEWGIQKLNGYVQYTFKDITWSGDYEETRPDANGVRQLNFFHISQRVGSRSIKTSGFGVFGFVADNLLLALNDMINGWGINGFNLFGEAFKSKINSVWYGKPTVYNKLVDWCKSHNVTGELY